MTVTRFLGVDLAWREGRDDLPANETGVAVLDPAGRILDAGWTRGVPDTLDWANTAAAGQDVVMFVDASLMRAQPGRAAAVRDPGRPAVRRMESQRA